VKNLKSQTTLQIDKTWYSFCEKPIKNMVFLTGNAKTVIVKNLKSQTTLQIDKTWYSFCEKPIKKHGISDG
jgi:hypothetical protein